MNDQAETIWILRLRFRNVDTSPEEVSKTVKSMLNALRGCADRERWQYICIGIIPDDCIPPETSAYLIIQVTPNKTVVEWLSDYWRKRHGKFDAQFVTEANDVVQLLLIPGAKILKHEKHQGGY